MVVIHNPNSNAPQPSAGKIIMVGVYCSYCSADLGFCDDASFVAVLDCHLNHLFTMLSISIDSIINNISYPSINFRMFMLSCMCHNLKLNFFICIVVDVGVPQTFSRDIIRK